MEDVHVSSEDIEQILHSLRKEEGDSFDVNRWRPILTATFESTAMLFELLTTPGATIQHVRKLFRVKLKPAEELANTEEVPDDRDQSSYRDESSSPQIDPEPEGEASSKERPKTNPNHGGKAGVSDYPDAAQCVHVHPDLKPGDLCPECGKGKLYLKPRARLFFVGSAPITPVRHIFQDLMCNLCRSIFKAPTSEDAISDGVEEENLYTYSAIAMMTVSKFFSQLPYYRFAKMTGFLGVRISSSSQIDQIEKVANTLNPVFKIMLSLSSSSWLYMTDDAMARILNWKTTKKKVRSTGREAIRDGTHSSVAISFDSLDRMMILIKTDIIHSGEWMDQILEKRSEDLPSPQIMWDRASCNTVTVCEYIDLACHQHARANFDDQKDALPHVIKPILEKYKRIFFNDSQTSLMTPSERLFYHQKNSGPIFDSIVKISHEILRSKIFTENSKLAQPFQYIINHEKALRGFLRYEGAPLSNNLVERVINNLVLIRRASHYYRTRESAAIADTLLSVGLTAAYCDVNLYEYFRLAQAHKEDVRKSPLEWLPWNFLERYPQYKIKKRCRAGSWPFNPERPYIPLKPPR